MGNAIGKIVDSLLEVVKKNYKRPKLWIVVGIIFFLFVLLIPYIDSNIFYYSRMEKRIAILEQVMALDKETIDSNQAYADEYQSILNEIQQQREYSINSLMNRFINFLNNFIGNRSGEGNKVVKFFTGALLGIIVIICIPFMNTFAKRSDKVLAFIMLLIITLVFGWISSIIPTFIHPMVNYIGIPLLQIVILIAILVKSNTKG